MHVAKWGNSLAVRLPAAVVQALELKEGDEVEVQSMDRRSLQIRRKMTPEEALETFKRLRKPLPEGFKFNREEANER